MSFSPSLDQDKFMFTGQITCWLLENENIRRNNGGSCQMTATVMTYGMSTHVTSPQANRVTAHTYLGE